MMQRTANENAACLRRICKRSDQPKIERLVNNDARLILLLIFYMVWPWFSCGTVCLFAVSLSRQWHDILDFSNCPSSRVLHVTLANWQGFGFEFHLGSSPSAFSGFVNVSQPAAYFTACYTVPKRPNKVETAVHGCNLAFSLDSIVSLPR